MQKDVDFDEIINAYRADPFGYVDVFTSHTGLLQLKVKEGDKVEGTGGQWDHIPGTPLYELNRERNPKVVASAINGVISSLRSDLDGRFVEANEKVLTIRHPLKKKEIIENILRKVLFPFTAPERAKYFFSLEIQARMDKFGQRSVSIAPGDEILTMSLMKRDIAVQYSGEPGIIHSIYFRPGVSINQGEPMFGVCPESELPMIQKIITRVKAEWE